MAISYVPLMDAGMRTTKLAFSTWNLASTPATPRRRRATSVDIRARTENIANARAGFAVGGTTIGEARFSLETRGGSCCQSTNVSRRARRCADAAIASLADRSCRAHFELAKFLQCFRARTGADSVFRHRRAPLVGHSSAARGILAREARVDVGMRAMSSFTLSLTLRGVPSATRLRAPVPAPRAPLPSGTTPSVRRFAQPRDKLPSRSVDVKCRACDALLYKYRKGGKGSLVKCYLERITVDHTEAPCVCPACGQTFARPTLVHGKPAHKIIGGKAYAK